jgi:hypothetical protein
MNEILRAALIRTHRLSAKYARVHVLPNHYYSSYADLDQLEATKLQWMMASQMCGIRTTAEEQLRNLSVLGSALNDPLVEKNYADVLQSKIGLGYGFVEAKVLSAMIAVLKPRHIVEVGGGVSSAIIQAALKKASVSAHHLIIEPYPSDQLKELPCVELREQVVQTVGFGPFASLSAGDFLFIDSSHTVKTGSDVNYLLLEVLPRIPAHVTIHFHDIFFPFDYRPDLFDALCQWSETSMLHAYLVDNSRLELLFSLSWLHHVFPDQLQQLMPSYAPIKMNEGLFAEPLRLVREGKRHFPSSAYLRTTHNATNERG